MSYTELILPLIEVTNTAAIASAKTIGQGERKYSDKVATEAMREKLNEIDIQGTVVIGEGERDEAPMLFIGEKVGTGKGLEIDIAVDPLEGTNLCATDSPNAICVFAVSEKGGLTHAPDTYMHKLVVGPPCKGKVDITWPVEKNIAAIAESYDIPASEVKIVVLERERNEELVAQIRATGAKIRLIGDGDICGGILAALPDNDVHALMGIGAAPEGVIKAAAMKALGGEIQAIFYPRDAKGLQVDESAYQRLIEMGVEDPKKVYKTDDLAPGKNVLFIASGVNNGSVLKGVDFIDDQIFVQSLVMDGTSQTIRYIDTQYQE